jgi:hypothetical protein
MKFLQMNENSEDSRLRGMLDHSRMAVCAFMLSIVVFNPFGFLVDKFHNQDSHNMNFLNSRHILNVSSKLFTFTLFIYCFSC